MNQLSPSDKRRKVLRLRSALPRSPWFVISALAVAVYFGRVTILTAVGAHLILSDPLVKSDVIVVLAGGTPLREIEAADLYRAGYASRIALTAEPEPLGADILRQRQVAFEESITLKVRILRELGVPESALTVLNHTRADSTRDESVLIREWVVSQDVKRMIVVTSSFHSRRADLIVTRALRGAGIEVLVRPASHDTFTAHDWWRKRHNLRNGILEWQKLLVYYLVYW